MMNFSLYKWNSVVSASFFTKIPEKSIEQTELKQFNSLLFFLSLSRIFSVSYNDAFLLRNMLNHNEKIVCWWQCEKIFPKWRFMNWDKVWIEWNLKFSFTGNFFSFSWSCWQTDIEIDELNWDILNDMWVMRYSKIFSFTFHSQNSLVYL